MLRNQRVLLVMLSLAMVILTAVPLVNYYVMNRYSRLIGAVFEEPIHAVTFQPKYHSDAITVTDQSLVDEIGSAMKIAKHVPVGTHRPTTCRLTVEFDDGNVEHFDVSPVVALSAAHEEIKMDYLIVSWRGMLREFESGPFLKAVEDHRSEP